MTTYKDHPAAKIMPDMTPEEYESLKADIAANDMLVEIELLDGKIIDGRHRYRACRELGKEPRCLDVSMNGQTPEQYVWSLNSTRRHLTVGQRAAIAAEMRKVKTKVGRPTRQITENNNLSQTEAAALVNVSQTSVSEAEKLQIDAPQLFEEVKQGTMALGAAIKQAKPKRPKRKEKYPVSTGVMKLLEKLVASSNMVKNEYGSDFSKVISHVKFDPDKKMPAVQLVDGLTDTLDKWRIQCQKVLQNSGKKSSTNTARKLAVKAKHRT